MKQINIEELKKEIVERYESKINSYLVFIKRNYNFNEAYPKESMFEEELTNDIRTESGYCYGYIKALFDLELLKFEEVSVLIDYIYKVKPGYKEILNKVRKTIEELESKPCEEK